jgi:protein-S-isoprenylcysteine O-methyltransferase Ste14
MIQIVRWLSLLVWLSWLIVYWRGGTGLVSGIIRSLRSPSSARDGWLILGIVLFSNVLLWTGYFIARGRIDVRWLFLPEPFSIAGAAMVAIGAMGTIYCRQQLGGLWSAQTVLLANHRLVDHGAYQVVRHPIYGFACLKSLGTVLVFPTWWNALAGGMAIVLYVLKGLEEEKLLAAGLPGYREYQQRVRYRIAPWIW